MPDNRGWLEGLYAIVLYWASGMAWLMQETYQFFSWTAVFFATVLGAHAVWLLMKEWWRKL